MFKMNVAIVDVSMLGTRSIEEDCCIRRLILGSLHGMSAPRVPTLHQRPGVGFLIRGDLFIIVWTGEPTMASNKWIIDNVAGMSSSNPQGLIGLQIIMPNAGIPDAETRRYIEDSFRTRLGKIRNVVTAPIGDSLRQSLIRTMLRGMSVIANRSQSIAIVATLDEAIAQLLLVRSSQTPSRAEILTDLQRLFTALEIQERLPLA